MHQANLAAAFALAIVLPIEPTVAANVTYSQGVLSFNEGHRVTVGAGGDYPTCDAAIASFPGNGPGGIIEFLPGNHTTTCGNLGFKGDILVTGRLGSNGERPRISTPTHIRSDGSIGHRPFITFYSNGPDNLVVENLDIRNSGKAINVWNYGGMVLRNVTIDNTHGFDAVKVYPEGNWWKEGGQQWGSWLEIYNTEVSRGGAANMAHNFYIGRLDRVLVDGLYTHSALASHAFKTMARDLTIRNSTFATTELSYNDALTDPYLSTTLLDITACGTSLVENNTFVGLKLQPYDRTGYAPAGRLGTSTASFVDLRRRRTKVGGCDDPRWEDADSFDWDAAAAGGYNQSNSELFNHVVRNNTFINHGIRPIFLGRNVGTAYIHDNGQSYFIGQDQALPDGWFERAVGWFDGNTLQGGILPGEERAEHKDYPYGAPIFVDGVRVGPFNGDPRKPVQVGGSSGGGGSTTTPTKPTPSPTKPTVATPTTGAPSPTKPTVTTPTTGSSASGVSSAAGSGSPQRGGGSSSSGASPSPTNSASGIGSQLPNIKATGRTRSDGFLGSIATAVGKVAADLVNAVGAATSPSSSGIPCSGKCPPETTANFSN